MRIHAIRGQNLASLAEFSLDFENGPLGQAGLFAITGPTGAGKTTLLDALCVALFDRTPRLGGARAGVLVGRPGEDDKVRLGASDVRALLRRGAAAGHAEVDFGGRDGRIYRARWSVRRARRKSTGRVQAQTVELVDLESGRSLGGTRTETLAAIEERLGLSFEQFRRSALLAQNEFAAFLHADRDERSALLERMTGTEIYSRVSMAAHRRAQAEARELEALEARIAAFAVLDDDEREGLERRRGELEAARAALRARHAELAAALQHHRDVRAARQAEVRARAELAEAERARDEAAPLAAEVAAVRAARERRGAVEGCDAAAASLRAAEAASARRRAELVERERDIEARAAALAAARTRAEKARRDHADRLARREGELEGVAAAVRTWLGQHRDLASAAVDLLGEVGDECSAPLDEAERADSRRAELDEAAARAAAAARRAQATAGEARDALGQARALAEAARREADAAGVAELRRARDAALDQRESLRALAEAAKAGATARATQSEAQREADAAACERAAAREAGEALAAARPPLVARLDEARRSLDRARLAAGFASQRHELVAGEPCPLCGADEHPWADDAEPIAALVAEHEERAAALQRELDECDQERAAAAARADDAERRQRAAAARAEACARDLEAARAAWRAAVARLGELAELENPAAADAVARVEERLRGLAVRLDELGAAVREAEALERAALAAHSRAEARRSDFEQASAAAEEAERAATEGRRALARCDAARVGLRRAALADAERELAEVRARLADLDRQRLAEDDAADAAARALAEAEAARAAAAERVAAADEAVADAGAAHQRARAALHATLAELADSAGDQAVAALAARELRAGSDRAEAAAPGGGDADSGATAGDAGAMELAAGATDDRPAGLAAREREMRARLARSDEWLRAREAELERAAARAQAAAGSVAECQRRLADLLAADAPALDEASAEAEAGRAAAELERCGDEAAAIAERLRADDQARASRRDLGQRARERRDRAGRYAALSELIGSSDGKKFRVFAQSLTLEALLSSANAHLAELAPRYLLQRVPGHDLDLQVVDRDLGDEVRSVNSLSGGESFLASLALALALSSLSARDVRVESLLVDEGFGSLDPHTLDTALSVLDALQATGRKVGLISHVPGLAERIGTRVQVVPRGGGVSEVRVSSPGL